MVDANKSMSMLQYKELISEGDLVIVYLDVRHLYPLTITKDQVFQSKYGALKHNDCIGKAFGSSVSCTKGWVYVLFPTPELWTLTLPHRTQILYAADISLIVAQLDLRPGSVVCEAGTGSGSLSHALIRAIAPNGFLHTFDFHEHRVQVAREEFGAHGLGSCVTVTQRDVCSEGFGLKGVADAVFLDLPNPWDVIPLVVTAFKETGGRLCTFSPCVEQVQRSCAALQESGKFRDVVTVECLQRTYDVKRITQPIISLMEDEKEEELNSNGEERSSKHGPTSNQKDTQSDNISHWAAIPPLQTPGHTGYLTYATYM
ncbi:hypothetical protein JTE90_022115 [Oedothorax gibbosus]|uniref:tRNA (adenine(58)-N(1))-methyltransferase catalytic subunit TRMT61A n=1 Tax=Oedothorax gibbosus TaxID=931172 RepID=A0AAV6VS08_9ARAC|nr:hypothetical protein JTE90_022115 [Oedothorax gibbosus]